MRHKLVCRSLCAFSSLNMHRATAGAQFSSQNMHRATAGAVGAELAQSRGSPEAELAQHRASTRAIFSSKTRTAPRREPYFGGPGLLWGGCPILSDFTSWDPLSGEGKSQQGTALFLTQRFNGSALEGYLFSLHAPDRGTLSTTEVSS